MSALRLARSGSVQQPLQGALRRYQVRRIARGEYDTRKEQRPATGAAPGAGAQVLTSSRLEEVASSGAPFGGEEGAVMGTVAFRQLPLIAKAAAGVAFFNSWVSFEEFVVNRSGLWHYMPYYRMADPCLWDLGAALLIVIGLWQLSRERGT